MTGRQEYDRNMTGRQDDRQDDRQRILDEYMIDKKHAKFHDAVILSRFLHQFFSTEKMDQHSLHPIVYICTHVQADFISV
jgi:hypothetical protein